MYSEERKERILEIIEKKGKVIVSDLVELFGISAVTVRKDLSEMEVAGLLKRTFGGAIKPTLLAKSKPYMIKKEQNKNEKKSIAREMARFLRNDMIILLDAGTTIKYIIPYLKKYHHLTILTFDLEMAHELSTLEGINIYFIGGTIDRKSKSARSVDVVQKIHDFNIDLSLVGCDGFNLKGFQTDSEIKVAIKKQIIASSLVNIVAVDSSKYGKCSFFNFTYLKDVDYVVTDDSNKQLIVDLKKSNTLKYIVSEVGK